jgi:squalene synthase HpnC
MRRADAAWLTPLSPPGSPPLRRDWQYWAVRDSQSLDAGMVWLSERAEHVDAQRSRRENFPVASRLLTATTRRDLLACYTIARLIDDVGDEEPGDRLALLDYIDDDLTRVTAGKPVLAPLRSLIDPVRSRGLPLAPFHDLVEANRMDQRVTSYADLAALRAYCRLSAEPVGLLVLSLWDLADDQRIELSNDVCTGLQIAEHLQDVGEDLAAGRVYLPEDTLAAHGVSVDMLTSLVDGGLSPQGRAHVTGVLTVVAGQARGLLNDGAALIGLVKGTPRVAVAGFVAGGLAALDAVGRAGADAVTVTPKPRRRTVIWRTVDLLLRHRDPKRPSQKGRSRG